MSRDAVRRRSELALILWAAALCVPLPAAAGWSDAPFDSLLAIVVTGDGLVDYPKLLEHRALLDRYTGALAAHSPISSPELFADRDAELAYWLNAYNASVLAAVADHYPIASVGEVEAGLLGRILRLGDDRAGFFVALRFTLGGSSTNLLRLEHDVVLPYGDPRVHFALNCASRSCPPLRAQAYTGARLDAQLDDQTRRFLATPHGMRIETGAIVVSAIFSWYRQDFTDWMAATHPQRPATLRSYLELVAGELPPDLPIRFDDYDWSLNDAATFKQPR